MNCDIVVILLEMCLNIRGCAYYVQNIKSWFLLRQRRISHDTLEFKFLIVPYDFVDIVFPEFLKILAALVLVS